MKVKDLTAVLKRRNTVGYVSVTSSSGDECFSCGPGHVASLYGEREVLSVDAGIAENVGDGLFHTTIIITIK